MPLIIKRKYILAASLVLTLAYSCRKQFGKPSWDTEILAPLIKGTLDINNLLPDSVLQANADSSLKIVYQNDIFGLTMDTLFNIPDTNLHQSYPIGAATTIAAGMPVVPSTVSLTTYNLPNVALRKLIIKSGKVRYKITSSIHHPTDFVYSIPCAVSSGGQPFSISITVPAAVGTTDGVYNQVFDLSGYTLNLTGPLNNLVNTIYTSSSISITNCCGTAYLNAGESVSIDNTFYDIIPFYAKGYFGENTINIGPQTSDFTLFKRIVSGTLNLADVNFDFSIDNPIGIDARIYVNSLASVNTRTNTTVALATSSPLLGSAININRATETSEASGVVYSTLADFPLNTGNSNIKPMIENLPDKFQYSVQVITNPLGNVSGSNDFIYSDKLLKARLNMEIPLSFCAHNLTLVDTLSMNLQTNNGVQDIKSGTLTLFANNGFPFDAGLQLYLLNDTNGITDSIFGYTNTIDEAPINASLRAIGKKLTKIVIPVNEAKMKLLYSTKKIALKVKFNTSAQPSVIKIYSDYKLDVNLVGDINYTAHLQ